MNIYEKLSAIQNELKAPKNQFNKFGNYKYRNCEDILEAVKPICAKNKATLVVYDEIVNVGDRYYVKAIARLYDQESEQYIEASASAREEENKKGMDASQITGSTSSYARKYALNGLFNIDDTKDSDATNTHGKKTSTEKVSAEIVKQIRDYMKKTETDEQQMLSFYGVSALEDLPQDMADDCYTKLQMKLAKQKG